MPGRLGYADRRAVRYLPWRLPLLEDPVHADPRRVATRRDFGRELTLLKDGSQQTVRGLAKALGVPPSTLGGYFAGTHLPGLQPPDLLVRLLNACGVTDPVPLEHWRQAYWRVKRATDERVDPPDRAAEADRSEEPEPTTSPLIADGSWSVPVSTRPPVDRLCGEPEIRGRDALVDTLVATVERSRLLREDPSVHVLHGLGGCGKSTVALATAHASLAAGVRTWWLVADDAAVLTAGMLSIATELGAGPDELRLGSLQDTVWRLLEALDERWLLIFDNADDPPGTLSLDGRHVTDGTGWLRRAGHTFGTVIVTTCDRSASTWGASPPAWLGLHEVECLTPALGAAVLLDLAGRQADSADEATRLAERLGGLPLALILAGRYLAEVADMPDSWVTEDIPASFGGYLTALDGDGFSRLLTETSPAGTPPARPEHVTVGRTWDLSLDLLSTRGFGEARQILHLLACLGSTPIPYELLLDAGTLSSSPLFPTMSARRIWETLRGLEALGLVDLTVSGSPGEAVRMLSLHPVVRDVSRHHDDVRARAGDFIALTVALLDPAVEHSDPKHPQDWARWSVFTDHCAAPLRLIDEHGLEPRSAPPAAVDLANRAAGYLRAAGNLGRAEAAYARVLATAARVFSREDPRLLAIRHDMARLHYDQGRLRDAESGFRDVLELRQAHLGSDHPDTLTTRHQLARVLLARGLLKEAGVLFKTTFETRSRILGETHPDTLTSYNGIADHLRTSGDHAAAVRIYERVLRLRAERLGPEHPATLVTRHYLASTRYRMDNQTGIEAELRTLIEANTRLRGPDHPRTLAVIESLVDLLHHAGRTGEAKKLAVSLVERRCALLGHTHRATLASRHRLGLIMLDLGALDEAEKTLNDVLIDRQRVYGLRHPSTLMSQETVAAVRRNRV